MNGKKRHNKRQKPNAHENQSSSRGLMLEDYIKAVEKLIKTVTEAYAGQNKEKINVDSSSEGQMNEQKRNNRIAIIATRIAEKSAKINRISLWVSTFYLLVTGLIFYYTTIAVHASIESNRLSDSTLMEARNEFNFINAPFIQIDSIKFRPIHKWGERLVVDYYLANLKSTVVKVYQTQSVCKWDSVPKFRIPDDIPDLKSFLMSLLNDHRNKDFNKYITKETPMAEYSTSFPVDETLFKGVTYGPYYIYLAGIVKYQNTVSGATRYYYYEVEAKPIANQAMPYVTYLYNENEDSI